MAVFNPLEQITHQKTAVFHVQNVVEQIVAESWKLWIVSLSPGCAPLASVLVHKAKVVFVLMLMGQCIAQGGDGGAQLHIGFELLFYFSNGVNNG